MFMYIEEIQK